MHAHHAPVVQYRSSGVGFAGLLALLFIGLKLTGHLGWAWIWILSPLWIPLAFGIALALVAVLACLIVGGCVGVSKAIREHGASRPQP